MVTTQLYSPASNLVALTVMFTDTANGVLLPLFLIQVTLTASVFPSGKQWRVNEFPSVTVLFRGSLGSRDGNSEVKNRNNELAVRYDYSFSVLQMMRWPNDAIQNTISSLRKDIFERLTSSLSGLVACLGSGFAQVFRQIVSIRVKTLSHTNLVALIRHIKMKEASQRFMCVAQKRLCVSSLKSNSHNQPYSTPKCNTTKHPFGCSEVTLQTCSVWYRISPWETDRPIVQSTGHRPSLMTTLFSRPLLLCKDE